MKIAVIGSGISGLGAAHFLSKKYKTDLFEKDNHFGGHSYSVDILEKKLNETISVDLGFIVFNEQTYPNLIRFFNELNVPFEKSNMSFSVSIKDTNVEYGGSGFNAIFANNATLAGHVEVGDWAILGGASNAHQFCKIGKHAMIAANSKLVQDVPPFILAGKHPVKYSGINSLGLTRRGYGEEEKSSIKKAYRYLFRSELNQTDALNRIKEEFKGNSHIEDIINFYESSKRGII